MEFDDVIKGRRSIRGYKSKPVSKKVLQEVLELAVRSPSSMNTQPWHFHIVTGDVLDNIRRENTEKNISGVAPSREIRSPLGYEGVHRERQVVPRPKVDPPLGEGPPRPPRPAHLDALAAARRLRLDRRLNAVGVDERPRDARAHRARRALEEERLRERARRSPTTSHHGDACRACATPIDARPRLTAAADVTLS